MSEFSGALRQQVLEWLAKNVPESRIQHILGVEEMAIALAKTHHQDPQKAAQAGLMHDLAKYFKPKQLLKIARKEKILLDPIDELNPHLLHADIGAVVARDEFGIKDEEVLSAIANHTLGRPNMSALSCTVFLADALEPGRGDTPELNLLRQISYENLNQSVWMTCDYSLQQLITARRLIHPRVIQTRNWFLHPANSRDLILQSR
jgi:predicted HD superfamily hydrolase involved in NAD metabolism